MISAARLPSFTILMAARRLFHIWGIERRAMRKQVYALVTAAAIVDSLRAPESSQFSMVSPG